MAENPAPPHWPLYGAHPSQWAAFERAGYDMRMFWLVKPIPTERIGVPAPMGLGSVSPLSPTSIHGHQ